MHLCTCFVTLAGDALQVVFRDKINPVTWPEISVLKFIHGEESVSDVDLVGDVEREKSEEYQRLTMLYGEAPVKAVFPVARFMEEWMPGHPEGPPKEGHEPKPHHVGPKRKKRPHEVEAEEAEPKPFDK